MLCRASYALKTSLIATEAQKGSEGKTFHFYHPLSPLVKTCPPDYASAIMDVETTDGV